MPQSTKATKKRLFKINGWLWRIVFAAAGFIFGAGVAWGVVKTQINYNVENIAENKACIDEQDDRLKTLENGFSRADERLKNIDDKLDEIKKAIK